MKPSTIFKNEFNKNVFTLMTGSIISQALPIADSPILTRIYSPEDFGLFGLYFAIVTVLSVLATGRYELAIAMSSTKNDAFQLTILSLKIAVVFSALTLAVICYFYDSLSQLLNLSEGSLWLYWVPASILVAAFYQIFYYWHNSQKKFKNMSKGRIIQSGSLVSSQLGLGLSHSPSSFSLIIGHFLGIVASVSYLFIKFLTDTRNKFLSSATAQKELALSNKNFPKYMLLGNTLNALTRQLPTILFNTLYTSVIGGFYVIIQRFVGAPISIIGSAIADVFRQDAVSAYNQNRNCKKEFLATFKKLFSISFLPFMIFGFISPDLFQIIFGETWRSAGEYAQILTPMFFIQFIAVPLSCMYTISSNQREDLIIQIVAFVVVIIIFNIGLDVRRIFIFFTILYSCVYLFVLYRSYSFAKGN